MVRVTITPRASVADVRAVVDTGVADATLETCLGQAACDLATRDTGAMSADRLRALEAHLAAHLVRFDRVTETTETTETARSSESDAVGGATAGAFDASGLLTTEPGLQVLDLDTAGAYAPVPSPSLSPTEQLRWS